MCGRYTLTKSHPELEARFDFMTSDFSWVPRYNLAPTQPLLAVVNSGTRTAVLLRWGLIPFWAKDAKIGNRMINARAETVAEKPSFRNALKKRRCLVLADGYYEWRKEAGRRIPMRITLESEEGFAFAGLWETWTAPNNEVVRSCAIITTAANTFVRTIHDRMPVILSRESESAWMDETIDDPALLAELLAPYPADALTAYPVSTLVNSPRNDTPECIAPVR